MKKLIPIFSLLFIILAAPSCKKTIEKKQEDAIMQAMVNGIWIIEQYIEGPKNISYKFLDYDFKFFENGTVTGTIASTTTNGTWSANTTTYSITSTFPTASDPLLKMNGVWKITDSYWDYVEAEMTTASGKNILHLRKKP